MAKDNAILGGNLVVIRTAELDYLNSVIDSNSENTILVHQDTGAVEQ